MKLVSTQNKKLSKDGIVSLNMPPLLTCPGAGSCKQYCYACLGPISWRAAKEFRLRAYNLFKTNPKEFERTAISEIHQTGRRFFRWHDSGDIMSIAYLKMMVRIANTYPDIKFYTYTKSIKIILKFGFENLPHNLKIIQSYGGKHDHLINIKYPFARIYKTEAEIPADFVNCSESDFFAATIATKIAILAHGGRKNKFK